MKKIIKSTRKSFALFMLIAFAISSPGILSSKLISTAHAEDTATVTILGYIDGAQATASSAYNSEFPMNAQYVIDDVAGEGNYALSASGYNGDPTPYQAMTSALPMGSSYETREVIDGSIVGQTCSSDSKFTLLGYTYGNTLLQAQNGTRSTTRPAFKNIQHDKYVIVWNKDCSPTGGEIGGNVSGSESGILAVTSIETVDSEATADGTFTNGWKYIFHVTVPTNETHLSMKFADWKSTVGSSTMSVANNMRISSTQADNNGETILLTAADTYSSPTLDIMSDLDPDTDGMQVEVTVDAAIPMNSANGAYTTSYGVQSE